MNFKRFVIIQCLIFLDTSENLTCQFTGSMFVSLAEVIDSLLIGISVYSLKVCENQRRLYLEISAWHTICHLKIMTSQFCLESKCHILTVSIIQNMA